MECRAVGVPENVHTGGGGETAELGMCVALGVAAQEPLSPYRQAHRCADAAYGAASR